LGSRIRDPEKTFSDLDPGVKKAPDPGVKKAPDPGSGSATLSKKHRIPDSQHCFHTKTKKIPVFEIFEKH
jgi:hypothetical protein